jgi:hypothetical protein
LPSPFSRFTREPLPGETPFRHAARRGSQSAYKARSATPDGNEGVQVHRERRRCKLATLKANPTGGAAAPTIANPLTFPAARETNEAGRAGESV